MKRIFKFLASVRLTTICLLLLFILTLWGTIAQVDHGLYAAQERYFFSFFFLAGGYFPFPGAQSVLWVMFFNIIASAITHFSRLKGARGIGLKITHVGILIYFVAAYAVFQLTQESHLRLLEGEASNVASSYNEWEIASWRSDKGAKEVSAFDLKHVQPGFRFNLEHVPIEVINYYPNAKALQSTRESLGYSNASGITALQPLPYNKDREKNTPGGVFIINGKKTLLYGDEEKPTQIDGRNYIVQLKRYPLPFIVKLTDFKAEFYPGTQMAKAYESEVEIIKEGFPRRARIFMNNPFRYKAYTLYQSSYDVDAFGREASTLAVVRNAGQWLPYIACFVVFLGLVVHLSVMFFTGKKIR